MRRVLEAIFRHPIQVLVLLIIPLVAGVAVGFTQPRKYDASASLWALRRYQIIGVTDNNNFAPPAQTQATALYELLQTRAFALDVANQTLLPSTLPASTRADQQKLDDALFAEISNVQVSPRGDSLYTITYTNQNPTIAQQVVAAVIHDFGPKSLTFSTAEGEKLLQLYQSQLPAAKNAVDKAVQAESAYLKAAGTADPITDPEFLRLHTVTQQAQTSLAALQDQIDTLNQQISLQGDGNDSLFTVLDPPQTPIQPTSRSKTLIVYGVGGLVLGLVANLLFILVLVRRDRTVYDLDGLQRATAQRVVLQVPALKRQSVALLTQGSPDLGPRRTRHSA